MKIFNKKLLKFSAVCMLIIAVAIANTACGNTSDSSKSSEKKESKTELIILAAASLTDACNELKEMYEKEHEDIKLTFSYQSSGALQAQIEEGAPADVFFSAATTQMDALTEGGFVEKDDVKKLLENKIVLVTPAEGDEKISDFKDVTGKDVSLIGLGDPDSVPAGQYAKTVFENMGIWDKVSKKANFGTDVRAVLTWVEEGEVSCGVVYATDAYTTDKVKIVAEAPEGTCDKVYYPVAALKGSEHKTEADEVSEFFGSQEALKVFEKYGFTHV